MVFGQGDEKRWNEIMQKYMEEQKHFDESEPFLEIDDRPEFVKKLEAEKIPEDFSFDD